MVLIAGISAIAFIAGIFSSTAAICITGMGLRLGWLYRKSKSTEGLLLSLSVLSWAITAACSTYVYFTAGNDPNLIPELTKMAQIIMYAGVFVATMLTYIFASKIFFTPKKIFTIIYLIAGVLSIIFLLDPNTTLIAETINDGSNYQVLLLSDIGSIILLVYVGITTLSLLIISLRLRKKTEKKLDKVRMLYAALGQLFILLTFTSDTLASLFIENPVFYAIFLWFTWILPIFASFFYLIGWTLPDWVKKKISS